MTIVNKSSEMGSFLLEEKYEFYAERNARRIKERYSIW